MDSAKDNYIGFRDSTITNYDLKGYTVTDDVWDGVSIINDERSATFNDTLDIKAGRKMGHDPAATFA